MRTVRISDLRRGHLRAEFVPKLRVESFHRSDSEGCTIITIERHSPDRFSTGPYIYAYMCAPGVRGLAPSRVSLLYRTHNRLPTPPRTAPSWVSAKVLANHTIRPYSSSSDANHCHAIYCLLKPLSDLGSSSYLGLFARST
jgi:hypothetical protein